MEADEVHDLAAGGFFAYDDDFSGHHSAGGVLFEFQQIFDVLRFAIVHFLQDFILGFGLEVGEEVGGGVGAHFFDDVGSAFRVQFFDDLSLQALVEFGNGFGGGFFVEGADDALALVGRKGFHDVGEVGGMEGFEFLAGEAEVYAAEGIRFDQIHEFPENLAWREFQLDLADGHGGHDALEKAADGAGKADVYLGDAEFGVAIGALVGEVNVIYADYFAAIGINDLLIE